MNALQALKAINDLCPFDDDPELSQTQQMRLVELAGVTDADGIAPSDETWTPTYDRRGVYLAARDGWVMKKARTVGRFDFSTDGQMFKRSQWADHCDEMIRRMNVKVQTSLVVSGD